MSRTNTKLAPPPQTDTPAAAPPDVKPRRPRNSGVELQKSSVRKALAPRREPHWGPSLATGQHVGMRKLEDGTGKWIARYYDSDTGQVYHALGLVTHDTDGGYFKAVEGARAWFKQKTDGIKTDEVVTVEDACRRYVAERRASKSEACSHDAEMRFRRHVYGTKFGRTELAKLRLAKVKDWRDGLRRKNGEKLSPGAMNRTVTALKAALNLAVSERHVSATVAIEWGDVEPLEGGKGRRDLYLDIKQRRALLKAAKGAVCALIEGAALTGARPGELVKATVSQFDARTKTMKFDGKTGKRAVILPPAAAALFTRLTAGKAPTDRIFPNDESQPWGHSEWDESVRDAAKAAELPAEPHTGVCLYTLRHSWITDALMGGLSTLEVARFVGTSLMMIEKHYGHLVTASTKRLAKVVML